MKKTPAQFPDGLVTIIHVTSFEVLSPEDYRLEEARRRAVERKLEIERIEHFAYSMLQ